MANSRYAYVKGAELDDRLLPNTYAVVRLDGKGFTRFANAHSFAKPNDRRALDLMNASALRVLESDLGRGALSSASSSGSVKGKGKEKAGTGIVLGFGESDEYSFCFARGCQAYKRRSSKILTTVLSAFTAAYILLWPTCFPDSPLQIDDLPTFDGRIVQYATEEEVRDYFRWRQVDTHINNLYNTAFWSLVNRGRLTPRDAHLALQGTVASDKHELMHSRFGINYSEEDVMFRKGSLVLWEDGPPGGEQDLGEEVRPGEGSEEGKGGRKRRRAVVVHEDLIKDEWWETGRGAGLL